jgi:hypothetical protein
MIARPQHRMSPRRVAAGVALAALVALTAFGAALAGAQQAPALDVVAAEHDPAGTVTVTISGPGAARLAAADVEALVGSVVLGPAELVDSGAIPPPNSTVVLAFETSSSMLFGQLERAQAAALAFLEGLGREDRVAVVAFDDSASVVSGFTSDRAATRAAIESLTLGTFAGIYAGVGASAELIAAEPGPKAIVVLGFGWDFGGVGDINRADSTAAALASGAAVYWAPVASNWDVAYFSGLSEGNSGRQLALEELPALALELVPAEPEVQTFRFASPVLAAGTRALTVSAGDATLSAELEVDNAGLVRVASVASAAPGESIVVRLEALVPFADLDVLAIAGGQTLPFSTASGSVAIDPWAFEAGTRNVELVVQAEGTVAATLGATVEIPVLDPQLTVGEIAGAEEPSVAVAWRVQGLGDARLTVTVDGVEAADTTAPGVTVAVPEGATVVARLVDGGGAELASETLVTTGGSSGGTPIEISTQLLVVAVIAMMGAIAIYFVARFARRPSRPPEFDASPFFSGLGGLIARLRGRRAGDDAESEGLLSAAAQVLVRTPEGAELRVPVRDSQLSVGASRQCDVTLTGDQVRFVHLILTHVEGESYRIFRFGPVVHDETEAEVADDTVIEAGEWIRVGDYVVSIEASTRVAEAA